MTGGAPSPAEGSGERRAKHDQTADAIRALVSEYHARLPRDQATAIGAAYARYSSRFQDSILDQIRTIFEDALRKRVFIPFEHVFFDLAVRGVKSDREGLNALRACLDRKAATVVFFFATNRLFRKTYRALQFVEEELVEKGVRAVFVKSGVDTAEGKRWRGLLNMRAMMDEFVVGMTADHVRAAHEGLLGKRLVFGTISFGYSGTPLDGQTTRRGRPRMALAIDPVNGPWVERVFDWYVVEGLSVGAIVRRLNADPGAPPPPKAPGRAWSYGAVRRLLANSRYRGCWRYGTTETVWVSSKDYSRQVDRESPLKEAQIEALRLIPDDQWFAAQARLAKEVERAVGRKPQDGPCSPVAPRAGAAADVRGAGRARPCRHRPRRTGDRGVSTARGRTPGAGPDPRHRTGGAAGEARRADPVHPEEPRRHGDRPDRVRNRTAAAAQGECSGSDTTRRPPRRGEPGRRRSFRRRGRGAARGTGARPDRGGRGSRARKCESGEGPSEVPRTGCGPDRRPSARCPGGCPARSGTRRDRRSRGVRRRGSPVCSAPSPANPTGPD